MRVALLCCWIGAPMVHVSISNRCGGHDRIHHRVHNRRSSITLTHNPSRIRSHSAALSEQWVGQFCDGWLGEGAVSNLILCLKGEMRASGPPQTGTSEWDFSRWIFNPPRQGSLGARASGPPQTGTAERAFQQVDFQPAPTGFPGCTGLRPASDWYIGTGISTAAHR